MYNIDLLNYNVGLNKLLKISNGSGATGCPSGVPVFIVFLKNACLKMLCEYKMSIDGKTTLTLKRILLK